MKLLLLDETGRILHTVQKDYPLEFPRPGWSQQDPALWERAMLEGIPELIRGLRAEGRSDIKVIAGGVIPPQDYDFLREAGVQGIYGPGTNVVECAADVLRLLGHNMPPAGMAEAAE